MTVSFLFGWQHILTGLVLLLALAALFLLVLAAGRGGRAGRSEWRAYLDSRSPGHAEVAGQEDDAAAAPEGEVSRRPPR
jgi:hypothetical protein